MVQDLSINEDTKKSSSSNDDLIDIDSPMIQQEILHLILSHLSSNPSLLPHTLNAMKEELLIRSRQTLEMEELREELVSRILAGDWSSVDRILSTSTTSSVSGGQGDAGGELLRNPKATLYLIYRQQFLELIESSETQKAFTLLSRRLKPLEHFAPTSTSHHDLSYLLTSRSVTESASFQHWEGVALERERLASIVRQSGGSTMGAGVGEVEIDDGRLGSLLKQAVKCQVDVRGGNRGAGAVKVTTLLKDYTPYIIPNKLISTFRSHRGNVKCVTFLGEDGDRIASGSSDNTIHITPTNSSSTVVAQVLTPASPSRIWSLSALSSGTHLAASAGNGQIHILSTPTHGDASILQMLSGPSIKGDVYSVKFLDRNERRVVGAGYDKVLRVWDVERGNVERTFTGCEGAVSSVAVGPGRNGLIASGSKDRTIRFWDPVTGICVHSISSLLGEISSVEFDQEGGGKRLLTSAKDNSNMLWDLRMFKPLKRFSTHQNTAGTPHFVRSTFMHSDLVISGSEDSMLYIWGESSSLPIATLKGHGSGPLYEAQWNRNQGLLVSCGEDRTVRTWGFDESLQHQL